MLIEILARERKREGNGKGEGEMIRKFRVFSVIKNSKIN